MTQHPEQPAVEQREAERVGVTEVDTAIYILWVDTDEASGSGKITSLSSLGCFIQTKAEARLASSIFIRLRLPTERWLLLTGEIIHITRRVGFGVRFTGLTAEDQAMLALLVEYYSESPTVLVGTICESEGGPQPA
ncbi:MAG TPA: PilZ domain-containing protein [Pyrinomonadaceae bacterium]|jgi:hypothetical protein